VALLFLITDLALFGLPYNVTTEPDRIFPDNPVTEFLDEHDARSCRFRILPENATLQPSTNYIYGYSIIRGYDAMEIPEFNKVINLMKKDQWADIHSYNSRTLDYESPILDLVGIKYILTEDDLDAVPGLRRVMDGPMKIYENREVMPKAFVAGHALNLDYARIGELLAGGDLDKVTEYLKPALEKGVLNEARGIDSAKAFLEFVISHFNFRDWVLFNMDLPGFKGGGKGIAELQTYENEYIRLKVEMEGEGILVVTDNFYPGWHAEVDGEEQEIFRSLAFRALPLKSGTHCVEFFYRPASFYRGMVVSLICLLLFLLLLFVPRLTLPLRHGGLDTTRHLE
jgi:hypothetical protein